jgi:hypothetical protein
MPGETNLDALLKTMSPKLNAGDFVFCSVGGDFQINADDILGSFREEEGLTIIINKSDADRLQLPYSFIASWISLTVHSSLEAVGLTAVFSKALAEHGISCNVVAAYYHDHIFVAKKDTVKAMEILIQLSGSSLK